MPAPAAQLKKPLVRDVSLRDGSTLRLQAPTPVDFDDIKAFYDGLWLESRHFRFHGFGRTDTVARADAEASGVDRLALIGRHDGRVVAVACYVGLREPDERDHLAAVASLRPILAPSSIAVVGAAATPGNVGRAVLANISGGGFKGVVTPVDRAGGVVRSMRAARSLRELEVAAELVIIAAAGDEVLEFAEEAAEKGARALLVLPPGSAHEGEASPAREERLLEIVRGAGMRVVGPSSLGVLNTAEEVSLNATFTGASVRAGGLSICSPSGAVGIGLLGHAAARQLGVSMFVSLGSRADVSTNDLLECWEQDGRTAAVILYVDTFGNPEHFTRIARRVSRRKPILALKGRRRAERVLTEARSHTAAALRGDAAVDALLQQAGVLRFRSGEELFDAAEFFERQPLPSGRRIGIVSNSAGVATLAADACATTFTTATRRRCWRRSPRPQRGSPSRWWHRCCGRRTGMDRSDRPAPGRARRSERAGRGDRRSRPRPRAGGRPRRSPSRARTNRRLPRAAGNRRRRR